MIATMYLLNRSPTKSLEGMTPYEAWTRKNPHVSHFQNFGCLCLLRTLDRSLKKLDDHTKPIVFIGYEKGSKGYYKGYDLIDGKMHLTRDVMLDEGKDWNWENCTSEAQTSAKNSQFIYDFRADMV